MTMVNVSGQVIEAWIVPGEDPTVVFVSPLGTAGSSWRPVMDLMTTRPRLVTYDRPATGASPPRRDPDVPVPYSVLAAELAGMLDQLGVTDRAVLVGHSIGSLIIRMYAARHPGRVAGMVHIDGSIPRLLLWPGDPIPSDGDGPGASRLDPVAGEREMVGITLPSVPGVVLVRTPGRWSIDLPDPTIDGQWQLAQADLAEQTGAVLIGALDAGHQIPREAPALVAYVVDAVVDAVRAGLTAVVMDTAALTAAQAGHRPGRTHPR